MMKKFLGLNRVLAVILLLIPFVGWVCELVVRWSRLVEKFTVLNLIMALVYTFIGWAWVLQVVDAIFVGLKGKFILID